VVDVCLVDPYPEVLYVNGDLAVSSCCLNDDLVSMGRVFNGIGQAVNQHLFDPELVAV